MKKEEALALGIPEDKVREFQALYSRDLASRMKHIKPSGIQAAIESMLPLIREEENLCKILKTVSHFYILENQNAPQQEGENENQDIVCAV